MNTPDGLRCLSHRLAVEGVHHPMTGAARIDVPIYLPPRHQGSSSIEGLGLSQWLIICVASGSPSTKR